MPSRLAACLALLTGACGSVLPEAELRRLTAGTPGPAQRLLLVVEIESATLSGTFDGVLVARPDPPAARLQLLPDLGAPILDVAATPAAISAVMHGEATPRTWRGRDDDPPPALALFLGITLLEQHAALTRARVLDGRPGTPPTLRLHGSFAGVAIEDAEVVDGRVVARTFRLGHVQWRDRIAADHGVVEAPAFLLRARVREREAAADLDEGTFQLAGPR